GRHIALVAWLQARKDAAAISCECAAAAAHVGTKNLDVWITSENGANLLLDPHHFDRGSVLRSLRKAEDLAGVLDWEEALRDRDEKDAREDQGGKEHRERNALMGKRHIEGAPIACKQTIKERFECTVDAAVLVGWSPHE